VPNRSSPQAKTTEADLKKYLKLWDKTYGPTYKVLEILQNIFYSNDPAREAFVEMCSDKDVQRLTFDSYLYKRVVAMNPWQQIKLTFRTLASVLRGQALAPSSYQPIASAVRSPKETERLLAATEVTHTGPATPPETAVAGVQQEQEKTPALSR
jgi:geranylgeranyl reductase